MTARKAVPARQPVISVAQGIVRVTGRASRGSARSQDRRDRGRVGLAAGRRARPRCAGCAGAAKRPVPPDGAVSGPVDGTRARGGPVRWCTPGSAARWLSGRVVSRAGSAEEALGIGMPSAAASWASVVRQFSQVAQALVRTWATFCSGRLVIALASRYPAAVVCVPAAGGATEPGRRRDSSRSGMMVLRRPPP